MAGIEWTDATWNPVTGCTKASPGCDNCYMFKFYPRLKTMAFPVIRLRRTMSGLCRIGCARRSIGRSPMSL